MDWLKMVALILRIMPQLTLRRDQVQALFPFRADGETSEKRQLGEAILNAWRQEKIDVKSRKASVQSLIDQYIQEHPKYLEDAPPMDVTLPSVENTP